MVLFAQLIAGNQGQRIPITLLRLRELSKGCRRAFINGEFVPGQEEAKHPIALMLVECDIDCVLIISEPNTKIQLEQWLFRAAKKRKIR